MNMWFTCNFFFKGIIMKIKGTTTLPFNLSKKTTLHINKNVGRVRVDINQNYSFVFHYKNDFD